MIFGDRLTAWRRYRGFTQHELSAATGILQPNMAALEGNRIEPKLSTIERLAAGLGVTAGTLIDQRPPQRDWGRRQVDALARKATQNDALGPGDAHAKALRVIAAEKLAAAGRPIALRGRTGQRLAKQLRADLGPELWQAVLRRLDKYI